MNGLANIVNDKEKELTYPFHLATYNTRANLSISSGYV
jgi:hypothetical protein